METSPIGAGRRDSYHHGDLREALLRAGEQVLAERGAAGFTLRACARQAAVSHAAPAHHFGDARGFLAALAARGFDSLQACVAEAMDAVGDDAEAQFVAVCRSYVGFAAANPELFRVMFRADQLDSAAGELGAAARRTFATLTNSILAQRGEAPIDAAALEGTMGRAGVREDVLVGWCHVHGMAHLLTEGQLGAVPGDDVGAFIDRCAEVNGPLLARALQARHRERADDGS